VRAVREIEGTAFDVQTPWHLTLSDETRAAVIKWAHDAGEALMEVHSHMDLGPACFSPSDLLGLGDFVPHVWWRLRHRPYGALVFGDGSFDGLVWRSDPDAPEQVEALVIDGEAEWPATGRTLRGWP
jgi:hypothetical protein